MADDNAPVESEITLEDFKADEQPPAKAESEPAPKEEEKPKEKAEVKEPKEEKSDDTPTPPDVPTKTDKEETPEVEDKPRPAEERKTQLNTEIRDLVAQRNALKTEVEKLNSEAYQVATEDELVEGGMTAIEAKVESMRQQNEMDKYNAQVADAQLTISSESDRVLRDFPIFNPDSEDYDKELAQEAAGHLESMIITDPNTSQVIGSNGSVYQYYKTLARASGISAAKGELKGQQSTEKMLANADAGASSAPEKKTEDPLIALWRTDD